MDCSWLRLREGRIEHRSLFDVLTAVERIGSILRAGKIEEAQTWLDELEQELLDVVYETD